MALRQRSGKGDKKPKSSNISNIDDDDNKKKKKKLIKTVPEPKKKKINGLIFVGIVLCVTGLVLYNYYLQYGPAIFLGPGWKDFNIKPSQWRKYLDNHDKTILLIGGPHRSGTTIVWKAISSHPEAVGFGERFDTGADFSEGILFQDVYPAFGVGMEFSQNFAFGFNKAKGEDDGSMASAGGLGQYALLPEKSVHMTKDNHMGKLEKAETLSRLMNRFAPHWDAHSKYSGEDGLKKAKVWIEKSPQNIVLSSFLEGVYNMPIEEDGSVGTKVDPKKKQVTKFIFMTRHPIANVLATDIFIQEAMGGFKDFEVMLRNYIQMHKYALEDTKELLSPFMWVKLEDFTTDPRKTLKKIFSFLELSHDEEVIRQVLEDIGTIQSDPNAKYIQKWCAKLAETHGDLIAKYNDDIKALGLGYDLNDLSSHC